MAMKNTPMPASAAKRAANGVTRRRWCKKNDPANSIKPDPTQAAIPANQAISSALGLGRP